MDKLSSVNLKFLGDAIDHWKGSLFGSLQGAGVLYRLVVDPMASDGTSWTQNDFALYAQLLHVELSQLAPHNVDLRADRHRYFNEIPSAGDLFLDPDTGIATRYVKEREKYITPSESNELLNMSSDRLLVVYQHVRAQPSAKRVDLVLHVLRQRAGAFHWCSYESSTVAMIFVVRRGARTTATTKHFRDILGKHIETRVRSGVLP